MQKTMVNMSIMKVIESRQPVTIRCISEQLNLPYESIRERVHRLSDHHCVRIMRTQNRIMLEVGEAWKMQG
jgi:predicted ArsR family transcriptional regulator